MESNIIYNYEDLKQLILNHTKENSYFLIYDDIFFEKIKKKQVITRDVYAIAKGLLQPLSVMKYYKFKVKDNYTTKEIYDFIDLLRQEVCILLTIFNPKSKEVFILNICDDDDYVIEEHIMNLLRMEEN